MSTGTPAQDTSQENSPTTLFSLKDLHHHAILSTMQLRRWDFPVFELHRQLDTFMLSKVRPRPMPFVPPLSLLLEGCPALRRAAPAAFRFAQCFARLPTKCALQHLLVHSTRPAPAARDTLAARLAYGASQ